jgi:thiol-disulfide isomerase/thioredoxin
MKHILLSLFCVLALVQSAFAQREVYQFTAPAWCSPCQQMEPIVAQLKQSGVPIRQFDIDVPAFKNYMQQMHVTKVPTFILIENRRELKRVSGMMDSNTFLNWYKD